MIPKEDVGLFLFLIVAVGILLWDALTEEKEE